MRNKYVFTTPYCKRSRGAFLIASPSGINDISEPRVQISNKTVCKTIQYKLRHNGPKRSETEYAKDLSSTAKELQQISKENNNLHILNLDVKNTSNYEDIAQQISKATGKQGLNLLINNAGVTTKFTKLNLVKAEQLLENLTVNTIAPILLTKTLHPLLKQASEANSDKPMGVHRAVVINMSSILGSIATNDQGGFYPYRCSKAALNAATKSMSIDLKKDQILVACVHPGWVKTDMGGKNAPLDIETSISGLFATIDKLGEQDTGKFLQYDGKELPW